MDKDMNFRIETYKSLGQTTALLNEALGRNGVTTYHKPRKPRKPYKLPKPQTTPNHKHQQVNAKRKHV